MTPRAVPPRTGKLLRIGVAGAGLALVVSCAQGTPASTVDAAKLKGHPAGEVPKDVLKGTTMTFTSYGGGFQDGQEAAFAKPFAARTGAKVLTDEPTDIAKIKAQVESGNVVWDVVDSGADDVAANCGKLFEPLDYSIIDTSHLPENAVKHKCYVPTIAYAHGFFYNADKYKGDPPTSWKDFFDTKKYPGKRAIEGRPSPTAGVYEAALLADGVAPDKLYPLDTGRALKVWDRIKEHAVYWETGAQQTQLVEAGEADMIFAWSGRVYEANENGANFKPVWNQSFPLNDVLAVPKGAPNKAAAMAFINYTLGAEQQAKMSELTSYSPVHTDAKPKMNALGEEFNTTRQEVIRRQVPVDNAYWGAHQTELTEAWTEWLN